MADADAGAAAGRSSLSRSTAARAALHLIDRDGLEAFSMRALGRELGVDPMAVYHYVPSKRALFDAVVEEVWAELALPEATGSWQDDLRALTRAVRDLLRAHPKALPIVATRSAGLAGMRVLDHGIALLVRAGLPAREAFALVSGAASLLLGHALAEVGVPPAGESEVDDEQLLGQLRSPEGARELPFLAAAVHGKAAPDWDEVLDGVLGTLIRGVEAHLALDA